MACNGARIHGCLHSRGAQYSSWGALKRHCPHCLSLSFHILPLPDINNIRQAVNSHEATPLGPSQRQLSSLSCTTSRGVMSESEAHPERERAGPTKQLASLPCMPLPHLTASWPAQARPSGEPAPPPLPHTPAHKHTGWLTHTHTHTHTRTPACTLYASPRLTNTALAPRPNISVPCRTPPSINTSTLSPALTTSPRTSI